MLNNNVAASLFVTSLKKRLDASLNKAKRDNEAVSNLAVGGFVPKNIDIFERVKILSPSLNAQP